MPTGVYQRKPRIKATIICEQCGAMREMSPHDYRPAIHGVTIREVGA